MTPADSAAPVAAAVDLRDLALRFAAFIVLTAASTSLLALPYLIGQ